MSIYVTTDAGTVVERKNDSKKGCLDANYASVTAPTLCRIAVYVNGKLFDCVHVGPGSSHSWWTAAGGKLLPKHGLQPGETLKIVATGACALRIDWTDE